MIAEDLRDLGITVDCLPVLDVPVAGADDVIGDRAYAQTPDDVAVLGRAAAEGLLAGRCTAGDEAHPGARARWR